MCDETTSKLRQEEANSTGFVLTLSIRSVPTLGDLAVHIYMQIIDLSQISQSDGLEMETYKFRL